MQRYFERKHSESFPGAQINIAWACLRYLSLNQFGKHKGRCDINRLFLQTGIFRLTGLVPSQVIPDCSRWFRPRLFFSWLLLIPDSVDGYCFNKQQHKRQTEGDLKWEISSQRKSVTGMIMLVNVLHKAR